jgi:hydrogenase expression/formation protein HypE
MQPGKLPTRLLASLLSRVQNRDPRVILGPGIGRDAAIIDTGAPTLLVAKADPITFASDRIGWYAVHVNANDIACLGAHPAWFLATVFLPEGAAPKLARSVFQQLTEACESLGIALVGGHTEITLGLERPLVSGAMLGEVERDRLVRPDGALPGDELILAGSIAIEGTAVLAREAGDRLRDLGVSAQLLSVAKRYLTDPGISVVRAASLACDAVRVHAMHDPTEGGLATALYEMSAASGLGIAVNEQAVEVLPATRRLCAAAHLDLLGLLASGALLIAVAEEDSDRALSALSEAEIPAKRIGRFLRRRGVIMEGNGPRRPFPRFDRDEVARFLSGQE